MHRGARPMYPQVFGKYVLERELARGGMARVVLATLRGAGGFEKRLVVKQIRDELASDDEFVRRFVEEAKTTVNLAHPNIVPVYELGVELGTYFLAMEWVDGVSVAELLRPPTGAPGPVRLTPEEGAYVGVEVCRALDYAHRRMNVVHRDVTPRNVMIDEEGQVKVIDFGIAAPAATASGHGVFGSPGHMPPEQVAGGELTAAADVFAVAVLLMEAWSGRPPFRRHTNEEIDAALKAPHPRPSDADIRLLPLDEVIASAMGLDPLARPQQADDLGRALRRFLSGVDLGDVARQLGERVRTARANPAPAATSTALLARPPSRPTATQVGTKTFAARAEVEALGPPRVGIRAPEPSTRRMPSSAPPDDAIEPRGEARGSRGGSSRSRAPRTERGWPRAAWLGVAGAGALATGAFFLGRGAASAPLAPLPAPSTAATTSETASTPALVATGVRDDGAARGGASAETAPGAALAPPSSAETGVASSAAPLAGSVAGAESVQLVLLGQGTTVRVDGVAHGPAPVRTRVDPGAHAIVFSFAATGETRAESVTVRAGERVTLRADFTGATPAVRVQRGY